MGLGRQRGRLLAGEWLSDCSLHTMTHNYNVFNVLLKAQGKAIDMLVNQVLIAEISEKKTQRKIGLLSLCTELVNSTISNLVVYIDHDSHMKKDSYEKVDQPEIS
jgi:hypothetical protein